MPNIKFSISKDFTKTLDFDKSGLCFHCGRRYCLHAEFYSLNGTSIMESVVLRAGACYNRKQNPGTLTLRVTDAALQPF